MSTEFEKSMIEFKNEMTKFQKETIEFQKEMIKFRKETTEFQKAVMQKLNLMNNDITELKTDVSGLKTNVTALKKGLKEVKEDTRMLKNEVFNVIKPSLNSIEQKVDIMTNVNTARIIEMQIKNNNEQNRNHKEVMQKLSQYEKKNELEHSRLNYEICKLKANA